MKSKLIFFLLFYQIAVSQTNFSEYFPLKIGYIYVYDGRFSFNSSFGSCLDFYRVRITINDTVGVNGKLYYAYSPVIYHYSGNGQCSYNPFNYPFNLGWIRLDTLTGKIYYYTTQGCTYSPDEIMIDSLNCRLGDTVHVNCISTPYKYVCIDTNNVRDYNYNFSSYIHRIYNRGIGLTYSLHGYGGSAYESDIMTMTGRVINGIVYGDTGMLVSIHPISNNVPANFSLNQNFPNPFNPATKIMFDVPKSSLVKLTIYNVLGEELLTLVNEFLKAGTYETDFDATNLPSGTYFYKLQARQIGSSTGDFVETKKMVVLK